MAGRQIHDDVRRLRKEMSLLRGQFQCQLCKETLSVDPEDKKTFLSRTEHDEVFGMQLVTYRVAHISGDERHTNTIIVDHEGFYRGHRDSYSEEIQREGLPSINHYFTIFREVAALSKHHLVNLAFITDREEKWVLEVVNPGRVKMRELALMAVDCVEEAERFCGSLPGPLTIEIADHEIAIWSMDSRLLCVEVKSSRAVALMDRFASLLQDSQQYSRFPNKHMVILAMRLIDRDPEFLFTPDLVFHF
ncbi:MAG: hypothetical protein ACXAEE_10680 [Candidatus Thorarchaeota archaeon]|jgi:hypothetical protein